MTTKINKDEKSNEDSFKSFINQIKDINLTDINQDKINQIKLFLSQIFKYTIKINIINFPSFYEYFQSVFIFILKLLNKKNKDITLYVLEEISFLLSNLKSQEILNYIYSNKHFINTIGTRMNILDILISVSYQDNDRKEELLISQVNLMKSIILKLDSETIIEFYDSNINQFPILQKSLFLYDYPEQMIRATIKNILLLITKIKNKQLVCYLTSFPVALYYPIIIYKLKDFILQLNKIKLDKNTNIYEYLEENHGELFDTILYLNDILLCNINNISFVLINCLLNEIIFPLLNIIRTKNNGKISMANAIYILCLFIFYFKNAFIIDIICFFLFQENIPLNLFEILTKYDYKDNNIHFIEDLNYLIKNINDADINDIRWKRNADFIKKDIGLDLYTGVIEKDNNYHYFKDCLINIKNEKKEEVKNDIFRRIREMLFSQDDSIIIFVSLLLYNVIYYYFNYFKNDNNNSDYKIDCDKNDNSESIGKNKIRNSEISKNNLKQISKKSINIIASLKNDFELNIFNDKAIFNPFLLSFFNISDINNNENSTLFCSLLKSLKSKKLFRISTNEIILNIIKFLIQIHLTKKGFTITEIDILKSNIIDILKDKISNINLLIKNEKCENLSYYNTLESYNYYKSEIFDTKIKDLMKLYYILVPIYHLDKNENIPFSLKENKTSNHKFRNHMINIFLLLDILEVIKIKNNNNNKKLNDKKNILAPFEV